VIGVTSGALVCVSRRLRLVAGHLGESAMEALAELVGLIITLRTTRASDHDAGRGYPGETSKPNQLPAHAHQLHRVLG
jgi:hypothetical protein